MSNELPKPLPEKYQLCRGIGYIRDWKLKVKHRKTVFSLRVR